MGKKVAMKPPSSESATDAPSWPPKKTKQQKSAWNSDRLKMYLIPGTILAAVAISVYYNSYLANLVNTPLNEPKIVDESSYTSVENLDRFWGSYRPQLYFGLKTRSSNPFNVGMMWFNQFGTQFSLRHWCDHNDNMAKYGWSAHDGRNFGIHDVYENAENQFHIKNSWVKRHGGKHGGDWTVRTRVESTQKPNAQGKQFVSVIFYFGTEYTNWIKDAKHSNSKAYSTFSGETVDAGKFNVRIDASQEGNPKEIFINRAAGNTSIVHLKESLMNVQEGYFTTVTKPITYVRFSGIRDPLEDANFIAYQVTGTLPFEFDVIFESESLKEELSSKNVELPARLQGNVFAAALSEANKNFVDKFERTFKLAERKFPASAIEMAQATLSNLIGGIGFFNGRSIVKSMNTKKNVLYWSANLYTAVPSRAFFPRGFLWDEGFHNLLISKWDLDITKDILGHWLDLMNIEGWIPREVILGDEARAKVPSEFLVQNSAFANPPTLFLPLYQVIHRVNESIISSGQTTNENPDVVYLNRVYKRLVHWYDWFNNTQVGPKPFSYRWRGRVSDSRTELNPKTLTSGLDDYPRASHPNDQERHLDLRCWMALASKVMRDLSEIIGVSSPKPYKSHYDVLRDNRLLDELHWSEYQYADYGFHSDRVKLVREKPKDVKQNPNSMPFVRETITPPKNQYVSSVGYVSLFPLILELLDADSPKLEATLDQIKDPKHLWTNFGLRSLSRSSPIYDQKNTEHDPPYWRGAIWININYLTLKSLKYYSSIDGPYSEKASAIYTELRQNVINNILKNYEKNGYIWEQYNDKTGRGQGTHPFTGWSALVVSIMSEIY